MFGLSELNFVWKGGGGQKSPNFMDFSCQQLILRQSTQIMK